MKKIKLLGDLSKLREDWELDVSTVSEALRAIEANRPGFIQAATAGEYAAILVDKIDESKSRAIGMENALDPWGDEILYLVPVVSGDFVVPAVLAATLATAIGTSVAMAATILAAIGNMIISMAISCIANVITGDKGSKAPQDMEKQKPSFITDGAVNVTREGNPYPVVFGQMLCGSVVLGSNVIINDQKVRGKWQIIDI